MTRNRSKLRKWVHKQLVKILEGRVGRVVGALRQILTKRKTLTKSKRHTLNKVIKYFENIFRVRPRVCQ